MDTPERSENSSAKSLLGVEDSPSPHQSSMRTPTIEKFSPLSPDVTLTETNTESEGGVNTHTGASTSYLTGSSFASPQSHVSMPASKKSLASLECEPIKDVMITSAGETLDIAEKKLSAKEIEVINDNDECKSNPSSLHLLVHAASLLVVKNSVTKPRTTPTKTEEANGHPPRKKRFTLRQVARMVWAKLALTGAQDDNPMQVRYEERYEKEIKGPEFTVNTEADRVTFDVSAYKAPKKNPNALSKAIREILMKDPKSRSPADIKTLEDVVARIKCFDKYSSECKEDLSHIIFYESYEDRRVIIQQGHIGLSFYFIVSGVVNVILTEVDKETGLKRKLLLGELSEGSSFGELALLHNIRRTATIVCKGMCEFLRVDKLDFEEVLASFSQKEFHRRRKLLDRLEIIRDWTIPQLEKCNMECRLNEFPPNTLIPPKEEYLMYMVSGSCYIVRELFVINEVLPCGVKQYKLPSTEEMDTYLQYQLEGKDVETIRYPHHGKMEKHFWIMCSFGKYSYFGVGEYLEKTYYISKTRVEVIFVPKIAFLSIGRKKSLFIMTQNVNEYIPDNQRLFNIYLDEVNWRKYKKSLMNEIVNHTRRKNLVHSQLVDVPASIRRTHVPYKQCTVWLDRKFHKRQRELSQKKVALPEIKID